MVSYSCQQSYWTPARTIVVILRNLQKLWAHWTISVPLLILLRLRGHVHYNASKQKLSTWINLIYIYISSNLFYSIYIITKIFLKWTYNKRLWNLDLDNVSRISWGFASHIPCWPHRTKKYLTYTLWNLHPIHLSHVRLLSQQNLSNGNAVRCSRNHGWCFPSSISLYTWSVPNKSKSCSLR